MNPGVGCFLILCWGFDMDWSQRAVFKYLKLRRIKYTLYKLLIKYSQASSKQPPKMSSLAYKIHIDHWVDSLC